MYAEGSVRSIKAKCLDRIIPMGEHHFRRALVGYVAHYHAEGNHQGLGNALITGRPATEAGGRIRRRPRLGGCLIYERGA